MMRLVMISYRDFNYVTEDIYVNSTRNELANDIRPTIAHFLNNINVTIDPFNSPSEK